MCGRYAASRNPADLVEQFEIERVPVHVRERALPPSYNVAPTDEVHIVVQARPRGEPDAPAVRELRLARWGLVPSWASGPAVGSRMINARMETVDQKPAFRRAFATRRALIPADGYFEWYASATKAAKQPFFIRPKDSSALAMAGLYEFWRDGSRADDDPAAWLCSCAILTTSAEDAIGRLHDRMPLLVERHRYSAWLDPDATDSRALRGLLVPAAPGRLEAYPVSRDVGNVANNAPYLVEPVAVAANTEEDPADATLF